jgi:uncharacterized protein
MRYSIKVKINAKENKVSKDKVADFFVFTKEAAIDNKANESVIKILAKFFKVSKSQVKIIKGHKSKNKIIEITE